MRNRFGQRMMLRRPGEVLVLVVGAIAIALIVAMSFMVGAEPVHSHARLAVSQAQARLYAESAVDHVVMQSLASPGWFGELVEGVWEGEMDMDGATVGLRVELPDESGELAMFPNPSFEQATGSLSNPLFSPPMSGTVGGWSLKRTALAATGLTVPRIGVRSSFGATDGGREAYITFVAALLGSGAFSVESDDELDPETVYSVAVDIGATNLLVLEDSAWFEVYAGSTLIVSTREAAVLLDLGALGEVLTEATDALVGAFYPAVLVRTLLDSSSCEVELRFTTDSAPPPGKLRIELHAESLGVLSEVTFDNVRVTRGEQPFEITARASVANVSHEVTATVCRDWLGGCRIIGWSEP